MLVIRKHQLEVFLRLKLQEFEDQTYARLLRFKPDQCAALGEQSVRRSIREAIDKTADYGIDREVDVARYINIMYTLGHDFDTNPRYPWAAEILTDASFKGESKVDQLCELTSMALEALGLEAKDAKAQ